MTAPDRLVQIPAPGWPKATAQALLDAAATAGKDPQVVGCYSDGFTAPQSVADAADIGYCTLTAPGG